VSLQVVLPCERLIAVRAFVGSDLLVHGLDVHLQLARLTELLATLETHLIAPDFLHRLSTHYKLRLLWQRAHCKIGLLFLKYC